MNRQKLSLFVSQRQIEHLLILLGILQLRHRAHIRIRIAANIRHNVALLQRHQRSEVTTRIPQSNRALEAEVRLPDQRQVNALEVSEPDILASEALNILDTVYNNQRCDTEQRYAPVPMKSQAGEPMQEYYSNPAQADNRPICNSVTAPSKFHVPSTGA